MLALNSVSSGYASCSRSGVTSSCQPPVRNYGSSVAGTRLSACHRCAPAAARKLQAAVQNRLIVFASSGPAADKAASRDDLPLWRHLREQEGFSNDKISELQEEKGLGTQYSADKVQHDLAPTIAALRNEGLTMANLEDIFLARPRLLHTTHTTFTSSLPVVRGLADHMDSEELRPYDPPLTRLGAALRDYPTSGGYLLTITGSYITTTQTFLQDELYVSTAEFAAAVFKTSGILIKDTASAQFMVKHLLDVYNGDVEKVKTIALGSSALSLEPAEFDRLASKRAAYLGITTESVFDVYLKQPSLVVRLAGEGLDATVDVIGRLMQAAEGMPADAPLQPQHLQAAKDLLAVKNLNLQTTRASTIQANWDYMRREGQSDAKIWAAFKASPTLMACHLEGPSQQLKAAWIQQEFDLGFAEFITSYPGYATKGLATMAMCADFLKDQKQWDALLARGIGPLLNAFAMSAPRFGKRLKVWGCTKEQLAAYQLEWLRSPAGLRWGGKSDRSWRMEKNKAV